MVANEVTLYHTRDCHLCELAQGLLSQMGVTFIPVDIATSERLVETYGVRIPVLRRGDRELGWPFDAVAVHAWMAL